MSTEPHRPHVSGDLPTVLSAGPMFRRAVAGYDRFQVDTYVRWAEDELAGAEREREHLVARCLRTQAELEQARQLLCHSSDGGEMLRLSDRIGAMLAAAADEARTLRAEARATRSSARSDAKRMRARAERRITDAAEAAARYVAEAAAEAEELRTRAALLVADAELTGREARTEAQARLAKVRAIELRAAEEARAARLHARDEIARMLDTGREARRRADAEAARTRERLDREAGLRRAHLLAEVSALEHRRASLRSEIDRLAHAPCPVTGPRAEVSFGSFLDRLHRRSRQGPVRAS